MKKYYYVFFTFLSLATFAQKKTFKDNEAFQKRIEYYNTTKEEALTQFTKSYGLDDQTTFLAQKETSDISGVVHQRHLQYYKGLKVEFGTLITHSKDGVIVSINGELYNPKNLNVSAAMSAEEGLVFAKNNLKAVKYLWDDVEASKELNYERPKGELVVFPMVNTGEIRLAYKYDIYALKPLSRNEIYVDAHSGEIIYKNPIIKHLNTPNGKVSQAASQFEEMVAVTVPTRYSGNRSIETTFNSTLNKWVLLDNTRGNGVVTYNSGGTNTHPSTNFTDTNNTWNTGNYATNSSTKDNAALDAHWGAQKTYDFWKNIFNRNSFDDNGAQIRSYVHYDDDGAAPSNWFNAHWNGSTMDYGDGSTKPLTAIDICGHEIGHAVCTNTANLAYQNHSGAMNEGFSDIWGACIEHYGRTGSMGGAINSNVWIVGEDVTTGGLRSMSNPNSKGDPNCYNGTYWINTGDEGSCVPNGDTNDNCGVHTNSGVLNYWFYLLTAGGSGTNNAPVAERDTYNVTGIGMLKAAQIAYFTERDYLTSNSTYFDARDYSVTVAKSLFGCGSAEHLATMDAWHAVNLGTRFTDLDLNLSAINGDANVACGASHTFSFDLQNFGSPSISSATITYSVDGGAQIPVAWSGAALSACSNPTKNYSVTLGALSRGTHVIVVTTTLAGDTNTNNNSRTTYVTVNDNGTVNTTNTFNNTSDVLVSVDQNGKGNSVWQRGTINKTKLTAAATGNSAGYATKLVGNYPDKTTSYLVSQCYNLSSISNASVSFDMAFDLESNWDIIYFEYSYDSGATWNVLGTSADANWYNSSRLPNGSDCFNCIGKQWTGDYATAPSGGTGVNGNKRNYSHSLAAVGNPTSAIFRFTFVSDDSANQEGVFIDNFVVQGTLGTNTNNFEQFSVYPNPSNGKFNVALSTSDNVKIGIYDLRGRSVYNESFESNGTVFNREIDLNSLSSGVYILNVESAGKKEARRIIIE